jgi:hypothetical protein
MSKIERATERTEDGHFSFDVSDEALERAGGRGALAQLHLL